MRVTIAIPAFDEIENLERAVLDARDALAGQGGEVLVVDDQHLSALPGERVARIEYGSLQILDLVERGDGDRHAHRGSLGSALCASAHPFGLGPLARPRFSGMLGR